MYRAGKGCTQIRNDFLHLLGFVSCGLEMNQMLRKKRRSRVKLIVNVNFFSVDVGVDTVEFELLS